MRDQKCSISNEKNMKQYYQQTNKWIFESEMFENILRVLQ